MRVRPGAFFVSRAGEIDGNSVVHDRLLSLGPIVRPCLDLVRPTDAEINCSEISRRWRVSVIDKVKSGPIDQFAVPDDYSAVGSGGREDHAVCTQLSEPQANNLRGAAASADRRA